MILRFVPLLLSNLRRRPLRTAFTLGSIVIAFLMFGLLGALGNAFSAGIEIAGQDRLLVMHKVSMIQPLPVSYRARIRRIDGVAAVSSATWFGGVYQDPKNFFPQFAASLPGYLDLAPELLMPEDQNCAMRCEAE